MRNQQSILSDDLSHCVRMLVFLGHTDMLKEDIMM